jgi:DNA helicase-2/ATP-dependent DNA helicase PcrA
MENSQMAHGMGQSPVDLLSDLTAAQREAVTHFEGPALVLAGPGSGKTRVITRRIVWLLQQGVEPRNILAITFTNKAAEEMRKRVHDLVPSSQRVDRYGVQIPPHRFLRIKTFHSFGADLLRIYADRIEIDRSFTIYDQEDRKKVLKAAMEAAALENVKFTPDQIGAAISKAKNQLLSASQYGARASCAPRMPSISTIC